MKTLVVYYSLEGNTKEAAAKIAGKINADLLQLIPEKEIPTEGFKKFMQGGGMATFGLGTKLKPMDKNPADYDQILLGTPIWAGKTPPAINQFFKTYKCYEKIVGVFTLSGSGNNQNCIEKLKAKCKNIKETVSLVDRTTVEQAKDNADKLDAFVKAF